MIEELSQVVLLVDIPEHRLAAGDVGTVVDVHPDARPRIAKATASNLSR